MESDESAFINNMLAPPMVADKRTKRYLASSSHGCILFEQDLLAPSSMQASDAQLMGDPLEARSLVASIGMTPTGFEMPKGEIISHDYHALGGIPVDIAPAPQPQIGSNNKPTYFKGSWTMEEDSILRDMVMHHGEGRWSLIAQSLPGRIGKQCRERWINHVDPNIKKNDIWTEEEDMVLIQAHKSFGSHWSTIAKFLPGWPENAIKNHWNSTKRSLGSKRRLKKKKSQQAPPGQLSVLEEYIRSLEPDSKSAAPQQATSRPAVHRPRAVHTSVPETELHLNAPNRDAPVRHQPRAISLGNPLLPDLNLSYDPQETHYMGYPMYDPASAPQLQLVSQEPRQATFTWLPFAGPRTALNGEHTSGPSSYHVGGSSSNAGYYNEAGPSNIGGSGDDQAGDTTNNDVLELASREFFMPSSDEVRLGLARFK